MCTLTLVFMCMQCIVHTRVQLLIRFILAVHPIKLMDHCSVCLLYLAHLNFNPLDKFKLLGCYQDVSLSAEKNPKEFIVELE